MIAVFQCDRRDVYMLTTQSAYCINGTRTINIIVGSDNFVSYTVGSYHSVMLEAAILFAYSLVLFIVAVVIGIKFFSKYWQG